MNESNPMQTGWEEGEWVEINGKFVWWKSGTPDPRPKSPFDDYQEINGYSVSPEHKIVTCCGCGFPVDQNNERCLVMDASAYMGTYGPCCAPVGRKLTKLRKQWAKRV